MKNPRIYFTTSPQVKEMLDSLVGSGLFGFSAGEAAERLVCRSLQEFMRDGFIRTFEREELV